MKKDIIIVNLIDWSKAFVDENGSFYCGTTKQEKRNAAAITKLADLVIETTDLHPVTAPEFKINGGLYPGHNIVMPDRYKQNFVYDHAVDGNPIELKNKTISPRLTEIIATTLINKKTGIIAPRGVYYQGGLKSPFCTPEDIEKTFGKSIISPHLFICRNYDHIIAPKQYFDATRLDSDAFLNKESNPKIPDFVFNVFTLIKEKYPTDKYNLTFINTGVVEGICRLHTSIGLKQMFPYDRVINISDASTSLHGIGLGYETKEQSREACVRVCKDIGIEYMTTEQTLKQFGGKLI